MLYAKILPFVVAGMLCLSSAAIAQGGHKAAGMTEAQVTATLKAAGYTEIHGVEKEGTHFDADAMKNGKAVHLHVNATTGAIAVANNEHEDEEAEEREH